MLPSSGNWPDADGSSRRCRSVGEQAARRREGIKTPAKQTSNVRHLIYRETMQHVHERPESVRTFLPVWGLSNFIYHITSRIGVNYKELFPCTEPGVCI